MYHNFTHMTVISKIDYFNSSIYTLCSSMTINLCSKSLKASTGMTFMIFSLAAFMIVTSATPVTPSTPEQEALNYIHRQTVKKIIIDVDAGVDDAIAIMLALSKNRHRYQIIAITCTHGNTNLTNVIINVLKTLRILKLKVPVYPGAANSLLITPPGDGFFGHDGFGDVHDPSPPSLKDVEDEHAAVALVRLARQNCGELDIIALGPLTNLALAQRLDPEFKKNVRQVWWMGGSVEGIGNIKPGIEFNAFMDPEANYIVFNATGPPVIVLPWETCLFHSPISKQWRYDVLGQINSPLIHFLNAIEKNSLQKAKNWTACDAKTIAVLSNLSIATKAIKHNLHPIFQGDARGALMIDYQDETREPINAVIVTGIDVEKFKFMCINNLSGKESLNKTSD